MISYCKSKYAFCVGMQSGSTAGLSFKVLVSEYLHDCHAMFDHNLWFLNSGFLKIS